MCGRFTRHYTWEELVRLYRLGPMGASSTRWPTRDLPAREIPEQRQPAVIDLTDETRCATE